MNEMIERVAEAMRLRSIERGHPLHPVMVRHLTVAAIEAMREAPEKLDVSRLYEEVDLADPGACLGPAGLIVAWRFMIDAALK